MKLAIVQGMSPETEADREYNKNLAHKLRALGHEAVLCVAEDDPVDDDEIEKMEGIQKQKNKIGLLSVLSPLKEEWMRRLWFEKLEACVRGAAYDAVVFPKATYRDLRGLRRHSFRRTPAALVFLMRDLVPRDCGKLGKQAYALLLRTNVRIGVPRSDQYCFETEIVNVRLFDGYKAAENVIELARD